jgi:microcompartment protein CcmK/EutM
MDARVVTLRRGAARAAFEETALAPRMGAARKVTREERAAVVAAIVSVV